MELRTFTGEVESTNRSIDKKKIISGYAVMWDKWSSKINENGKEFFERIVKGAFKESLRNKNQIALYQHYESEQLGSVREKTLFLEEDSIGLAFKIILPDNNLGKRIYSEVRRKKLKHVSFTFMADEEGQSWENRDNGTYRTINKAILVEISPVYTPAYSDSVVVEGDQRTLLFGQQTVVEIKKSLILNQINEILKK